MCMFVCSYTHTHTHRKIFHFYPSVCVLPFFHFLLLRFCLSLMLPEKSVKRQHRWNDRHNIREKQTMQRQLSIDEWGHESSEAGCNRHSQNLCKPKKNSQNQFFPGSVIYIYVCVLPIIKLLYKKRERDKTRRKGRRIDIFYILMLE